MCLFIYGVVYLTISTFRNSSALDVAENCFISFLPFLIVFGFYVFYQISLSSYIYSGTGENKDFEAASKLLEITKKLFVSSVLSYLILVTIDILYVRKEIKLTTGTDGAIAIEYIHKALNGRIVNSNSVVLLSFVFGLILLIALYYLIIERKHHTDNNEKK